MNNSTQQIERRLDFAKWFFSIFSWDGLLPVFVLSLPYLIAFIPNKNPNTDILLLVSSVIVIFLIRFSIGRKKINENSCGKIVQKIQHILFSIGVFYMLLVDSFVCTIALFAMGAGGFKAKEIVIITLYILPYLFLMTIAMYPGKTTYTYEEKDYLDKDWAE